MKIKDIYTKYLLPQNLQEHMLRVAALSTIIIENWKGEEIPSENITNACLFHDIAKPLTFSLEKQKLYGTSPTEIENIEKLKKLITEKYGAEEHYATLSICKEECLSENAISIMREFEWSKMQEMFDTNNIPVQIVLYCDMRIGPNGILPLIKRLENIRERYTKPLDHELFSRLGQQLESMIQKNVGMDLQKITNEDLNGRFSKLLNREI